MSPARPEDPPAHPTLAAARLVAFDVDGTLTDGRVVYTEHDRETQAFDVRDGQGLVWLIRSEIEVVWITGRGCRATMRRAGELGVREVVSRSGPKREKLAEVQERLGIGPEETVAMGDDLPDLAMQHVAGFFCAPADARPEVRAAADWVTPSAAGRGAARDLCEVILRARGRWQSIVDAARR